MRQLFFLLLFLFFQFKLSFGQRYDTESIIKKADSVMRVTFGEKIFKKYFQFDSSSYYEYKKLFGKTSWKRLTATKKTKGEFKNISVRYSFCLGIYNVNCIYSRVQFDSILNQKGDISKHFIPQFILDNTECNFISDTFAINVAKTKFTKKGITPLKAGLSYDYNNKRYVWTVDNTITKSNDSFGKDYGEIQLVEINALTGEIIHFYPDAIYGPVR